MSSRIFSSHFQDSVPSDLEPQFDLTGSRCNYQIKRNSIEGPLIRYASLGETVYHVWKCYGENIQILVQNCYVEDGEGNHILISPYVHCPKNKERDTKRSRSTDAFVQAPPTKRTLAAQVTPGIAVEITSKESWNAATRELDLITLPAYSQSLTAITEASKTEELFFISTANDYGFDLVSSDPLPPSIHPTQRNSEEEIQVELSIYQRRAKWNSFTNRVVEKDVSSESLENNKDHSLPFI
ncbi:hypothetical protein LOAG_00171 [Loa loa]|uniref:Cuticlin C-terminal domain-containing protein n=1 Tax=Loa loa TaxID=7209 RepID=A0A1S0UBQ8_LOALO|nr:hypothetical protein LOAG_00171 [Loa loa]EFO28314.1 hypothetical protein LOAG_00171 [Loa loa]